MADALATLARLRRLTADYARRELAAALAEERDAAALEAAALDSLRREAEAAVVDAAHPLAGRFSEWLPAGQAALLGAVSVKHAALARVGAARGLLGEARAAERAVTQLREAQGDRARVAERRAEQVRLDDLVRIARKAGD